MKVIQCLSGQNKAASLENYFKKLAANVDAEVQFIDWEEAGVYLQSPVIVLLEIEQLDKIKNLIGRRDKKIIIGLNARKDYKVVTELKDFFSNIFGFLDISQEIEYNIPLLKNYLLQNFHEPKSGIQSLLADLEKILDYTKNELLRVRDLHDRFVKIRMDKYKGITLTSKFMAGEKSGGEFFDVFQNENELFFMQLGSNSYLLTSMIISEIELQKEKKLVDASDSFLEQFQKIISFHAQENKAELTYCLMKMNLKNLQSFFELKGLGFLFIDGELYHFGQNLKLKLKPGDKIHLISEGAMKNWELLNPHLTIKSFFQSNKDKDSKDLVNEFFFELTRNKKGSFLIYDAFMSVLEIDQSIIYQLPEDF